MEKWLVCSQGGSRTEPLLYFQDHQGRQETQRRFDWCVSAICMVSVSGLTRGVKKLDEWVNSE